MKAKQYSSLIITGSIAYDQIMDFPKRFVDYLQPEKLHQINVAFVVDKMEKQIGGIALNVAYNAKLITDKKIFVYGSVGIDGKKIIDFMRKNKIDTTKLYVDKKLFTTTGVVITDIKDNQIWGYYYGAAKKMTEVSLNKNETEKSLMLIASNYVSSMIRLQDQAAGLGIDYLYDPGMVITSLPKDKLQGGVLNSKWLIGNDYEIFNILKMTGFSVKELNAKGIAVITTLGELGVKYEDNRHKYYVGGYKTKKVIDPTGAGDAWRGGFMAGIINGLSIDECLRLGNVLASFAIESFGTVNHRPKKKDIETRLHLI